MTFFTNIWLILFKQVIFFLGYDSETRCIYNFSTSKISILNIITTPEFENVRGGKSLISVSEKHENDII